MLRLPEKAGAARLFVAALGFALAASLIALALYLNADSTHTPEAGNQGRSPVAQAIDSGAEADSEVRRLRAHLERQPRDARGWVILARLQADRDRFQEAAQAYEIALALPSKVANDPAVWCEYADALGMTQGGKLAGRPRELIERALALNPNHPKALEMAGSAEYGQGDYASALRYWRPLLAALEPGSRAHTDLAAAIARTERMAATSLPARRR